MAEKIIRVLPYEMRYFSRKCAKCRIKRERSVQLRHQSAHGLLLEKMGHLKKSEKQLQRAIELKPQEAE